MPLVGEFKLAFLNIALPTTLILVTTLTSYL